MRRLLCCLLAVCVTHCIHGFILDSKEDCPSNCSCFETRVICPNTALHGWPFELQNAHFLQELDLEYNPDLGNIPRGAFYSFQHSLNYLYLSYSGLTQIPPDMKHLHNLIILDMDGNAIGDSGFPDDAFGIGPMAITTLELQNTSLTKIPLALCSLSSLHYLALGGNDMKMISDEQASCIRSVAILSMDECGMSRVPSSFRLLTKLTTLHLTDNPLRSIEHFDLFGLTNLRDLELHNTSISYISSGAFQWTQSLRNLDIRQNNITEVPYAFSVLNNTKVNLQNNHLQCSCDLTWAIDWMNSTSSRIFGECENHAVAIDTYIRTVLTHCPS